MKPLGKSSLSSFLKKLITIIWYLEFLFLLTLPLVFMDDGGLRYSWPITLNTSNIQPRMRAVSEKISGFKLHERYKVEETTREQILSFEDSTLGRKLLQTLHNLVYIALIMFVTWQLKQIFSGFSDNQPFPANSSVRIKWIAFAVLFLVIFDIIEAVLHRLYTGSTIMLSGATFDKYNYTFDYRTFILGLLLLIIAEVFRRGTEYQADSESIL
ncbi:MAG TPA: DUF2975 domain-containing protein [Pedobacter sp.]|jgi:hypothetical protein